jgi:RNA polymerase sigma-70 factor, ECF subfamily
MVEEKKIQDLVRQAQNGKKDAFGELYEIFSARMFNFLIYKIKHRQLAEDLLHTVFLKAYTNLGGYVKTSAKFSTWLFKIANYTVIDYWRVKKETIELDKVENLPAFASEQEFFEKYDYLWDCLTQLSDEQRTVLELRFRQDLSVEETCQVMNKSAVAIRVLQHRALKALKNKLKDKGIN